MYIVYMYNIQNDGEEDIWKMKYCTQDCDFKDINIFKVYYINNQTLQCNDDNKT